MLVQVFTGVVVLLVAYFFFSNKRPANSPPFYGSVIPFFGCFIEFGKSPMGTLRWAYDKYGDCFTLKMLGQNMTYMIGPDAQAVFFKASDEELSPKEAYKFMIPVFGQGVVYDSPTEVMYEQLRFVRSSLTLGQLKKAVPIIAEESKGYFARVWGDEGSVDILDHLNKLTILTASRCLMGNSIRKFLGEDNDRIAYLYHELEKGINPLSFFFPRLPLPGFKRRDEARGEVADLFKRIIQDRRKEGTDSEHEDIMSILMQSEYKDGSRLEDEQLAGLMIALLFAGQHTSSITATWTGTLMHNHKQYLTEVLDELHKSMEANNGQITFDSVKTQTKLENCIRETLRMFPPLIILMRKALVDMVYVNPTTKKEMVIPAGDIMCVSPGAAMRLDNTYKNPDKYDPHRIERGEHNEKQFAYISFGGGRHGCPGENFGMLQIKTIWSILLSTYELDFGPVPPIDYTSLVAGPKAPVMVRYKRKQPAH